MEENNIEIKENITVVKNNNNQQIVGAIILAGVLIAGAILLKGGGTPAKIDPVKQEAELTKSMLTFSSCLDSGKYAQAVADSKTAAVTAGVNGTPKGFILRDGKIINTIDGAEPYGTVKQKIDDVLADKGKAEAGIKLQPVSNSDFLIGNPQAKVAIVMYEDFQCPFCGRFFTDSEQTIRDTYIKNGQVQYIYRDFAFLGPESVKASEAARCAADQGKFWQYHDYLFTHQNGENQGNFSSLNLKLFAKEVGLK
jgi:protein-disulfide isomerase